MNKNRAVFSIMVMSMMFASCGGSDSNDIVFSIYATPSRAHAPVDMAFELSRDDGESVENCTGKWIFGDGVSLDGTFEANHRYRASGSYDVNVTLDCDGKKGQASTSVEIYDTIDLSVAALEARPLNVSTNGTVTVSVQVANQSETALRVPTYVDIYLTPTRESGAWQSAGSVRVYRHVLDALPASGEENSVQKFEFSVPMHTDIRTGSYYVAAVVNADLATGESQFDNNETYSSQTVTVRNQVTDGADLLPERLSMQPESTRILSAATASFSFVNQGATTDEPFHYQIWMGAKDQAVDSTGAVMVHESTLSGAMSGVTQIVENVLISVTPAVSEPGLYYFWLVLDSANEIVERDETNNEVRSLAPIRVNDEPVLDADIIVEEVSFSPASTSRGGSFTANVKLLNQGSQPTGSFVCTIFLSEDMSLDVDKDYVVGSANIDDLASNEQRELSVIVNTDARIEAGKYWVYLFCDSSGVVSEANEDNNAQRSLSQIHVTGSADIDLVVGQGQWDNEAQISDGDLAEYSTTLCNKGKTAAGPSYLVAYRKNMCNNGKVEIDRKLIDGLEPDECQKISFQTPLTCDFWCPHYQIELEADGTGLLTEKTRTNNQTLIDAALTMSGADCICAGDDYEPNSLWSSAAKMAQADDDLTVCQGDKDYFLVELPEKGSFEAQLSHDSSRAPLKFEMYRGTSDIESVYTGGDLLYLSGMHVENVDAAPVYLVVSGVAVHGGNHYHLKLNTYSDTDGTDVAVSALKIDGLLNAAEETNVSLQMDNLGKTTLPSLKLGFYLSTSGEIDASSTLLTRVSLPSMTPAESVTRTFALRLPADLPGGRYHLIARADDDKQLNETRVSNNIARSDAWTLDRSCYDSLDPNDSFETARTLILTNNLYTQEALTVCQNNPDYYKIDVRHGQALEIEATALNDGDFDLYLYDQKGNEISASRTGNRVEKISMDYISGDQTLYIKVDQLKNVYNTNETNYALKIQTKDAASWMNCSSAFEPNQFISSAYDLKKAALSGETADICPENDEDYYQIDMKAGDRLRLGFNTQSTIIRAGLYKGPDAQFLSLLTNLRLQSFDYTALTDDTYYVRIFTNASAEKDLTYQLVWLAEDGIDLAISGLSASTAIAGMNMTLSFNVENRSNQDVDYDADIWLDHTHLGTFQSQIQANASKRESHKVSLPSSLSGSHQLTVELKTNDDIAPDNNEAQMTIDISNACTNDTFEPNDNILKATSLTRGSINAVICPGDEDWFALPENVSKASLNYRQKDGELMLTAYDRDGNLVGSADTASDTEVLTLENAAYLKVMGTASHLSNTYQLVLE